MIVVAKKYICVAMAVFILARGRIFHLDELSSVVRLERRTTDDSSSGTDNVSSSIKTVNMIVSFGCFSKSNY